MRLECNIKAVSHKTVISFEMWKCYIFSAQEKNGLAGDSPIVLGKLSAFFFFSLELTTCHFLLNVKAESHH